MKTLDRYEKFALCILAVVALVITLGLIGKGLIDVLEGCEDPHGHE